MILKIGDFKAIDLSSPVPYKYHSKYPIGFIVSYLDNSDTNESPDRCEYLLDILNDPRPLQNFLSTLPQTHPEFYL